MSSLIREAATADWPAAKRLIEQAGLPIDDLDDAAWRYFIVAETTRGLLEGVIGLEPIGDIAMLRSLAVNASHRRSGLGSALVARAEARARSLRLRDIYLLTTTAEAFFAKRGYRRIERESAPPSTHSHAQFKTLCPESAALMVKSLHVRSSSLDENSLARNQKGRRG
jgi:amino-acid N-acetyltransferase